MSSPLNSPPNSLSCDRNNYVHLGLCALVVIAGLAAYSNSFTGAFIFDDDVHIRNNPAIEAFWTAWPNTSEVRSSLGLRRPVAHLTLAVNYALGGLSTTGYHVFNVTVHLLSSLALFGLVRGTLRLPQFESTYGKRAPYLAFAAAIIWTVHPLGTQSVTYVIQRCESLMGLCYLASLYFTMRGSQSSRSLGWYAAAVVVLCIGMGTKEVMATAPMVILLYDRVFLSDSWRNMLSRRWGLYLAFSIPLVRMGMAVVPAFNPNREAGTIGFSQQSISSWDYLSSQPGVILHYLHLTFWPNTLSLDYAWPVAQSPASIYLPGALIVALLLASIVALRCCPSIGFLGLAFFIILAPTSSFVPFTDLAVEHRMYLPLAGVVVLMVLACDSLVQRYVRDAQARRVFTVAALVVVVIPLGLRTIDRNRDYQDPVVMWQDVVRVVPKNVRAHVNLGASLVTQDRLSEATSAFEQALTIKPDYVNALTNLGDAWERQGELERAAKSLQKALRLRPDIDEVHNRLGIVLMGLGNLEGAAAAFERAVELQPENVEALNNLGILLMQRGELAEAIDRFDAVLIVRPENVDAQSNLGLAHSRRGDWEQAVAHYEQAIRIDPELAVARSNLGAVLQQQGNLSAAATHLREAIRIQPELADAHNNLGVVVQQQGDLREAAASFEEALRLKPDDPGIRFRLAVVLDRLGDAREAVGHLRQMISTEPVYFPAALRLVWILAASVDSTVRNGPEAVSLGEQLAAATDGENPAVLDVLAAAYAEAGRWNEATAAAGRALELATAAGQGALGGQIEARLRLFEQQKPFRSPVVE